MLQKYIAKGIYIEDGEILDRNVELQSSSSVKRVEKRSNQIISLFCFSFFLLLLFHFIKCTSFINYLNFIYCFVYYTSSLLHCNYLMDIKK